MVSCLQWREREKSIRLQQPYLEDLEEIIGKYLFDTVNIDEAKRTIQFWVIREKKEKEKEDNRNRQ